MNASSIAQIIKKTVKGTAHEATLGLMTEKALLGWWKQQEKAVVEAGLRTVLALDGTLSGAKKIFVPRTAAEQADREARADQLQAEMGQRDSEDSRHHHTSLRAEDPNLDRVLTDYEQADIARYSGRQEPAR